MSTHAASFSGSGGFLSRLLKAFIQSLAMKIVTFTLTTVLTRRISHEVRGVLFTLDLYCDTIGFLAKEAVRSCALRSSHQIADDGPRKKGRVTPSTGANSTYRIAEIFNTAVLALPAAVALVALFESAAFVTSGHSILPSFQTLQQTAPGHDGADSSVLRVSWQLSLMLFLCSVILQAAAEPKLCVFQSFGLYHVKLTAEAIAVGSRVLTLLTFTSVPKWATSLESDPVRVSSVAVFMYGLAYFCTFEWFWYRAKRGCSVKGLSEALRGGAGTSEGTLLRSLLPLQGADLFEWNMIVQHAFQNAVLMRQFFTESITRMLLTEGEKFALSSFASLQDQGVYDTVMNLGSLVARLVFRLWEESCFAKWCDLMKQPDTSMPARFSACRNLLHTMLTVALQVALPAAIFGPPLAQSLLMTLYASRWSDAVTTAALTRLCLTLPLMAWNGLLEAFVRATSTASGGLNRAKVCMALTSSVYIAMCFLLLLVAPATSSGIIPLAGDPLIRVMEALLLTTCVRIAVNLWLIARTHMELAGAVTFGTFVKETVSASIRWEFSAAAAGLAAIAHATLSSQREPTSVARPLSLYQIGITVVLAIVYCVMCVVWDSRSGMLRRVVVSQLQQRRGLWTKKVQA